MTIPADVNSVSKLISDVIESLRALPHNRDLKEPFQAIADMQIWLAEERDKPLTAQEDSGLQGLQDVLLNDFRPAAKWKRLRLLFEPSTFAEKLRNMFIEIRDSCDKLQVPSKSNIVEQLDKVILDLSDGDLSFELNRAETEFKKQFCDFLRENRNKSVTSEDKIYVRTWLAEQLGTDVNQELEEIKEHGGTFIEELIVNITEREERKCIVVDLVAESSEERIKSQNEGGESSDASFKVEACAKPLDVIARDGVQALNKNASIKNPARVYQGLAHLTKCTKLPGGIFEVYKAGAIAEAIRLAKAENGKYITQAVKLLEALTSSRQGVALGSERDDIYIEVSDHVEVLIELMKRHPEAKRSPEARLLAAKTVVNILVNQSVWQMVRSQYDIVSALVAISNDHPADRSIHDLNQADRVCLLGLTRLMKFSNGINLKIDSSWDKTQIIVTDNLIKLLRAGLMDDGEANLAKDSLVALDSQVLVMGTPAEVWTLVRKHMSELMVTDVFVSHSSVPGRMAIVSIMAKVCRLYKEDISEGLFLYLLELIKSTGHEISITRSDLGEEQVKVRQKLLSRSVKLLCFCVIDGKKTVQCVLSKFPKKRAALEQMLNDQDSEISNESRLEIMDVLDKIDDASSQNSTVAGGVAKLVKMFSSSSPASRPQIASRLLKCVKEQRDDKDLIDMKKAGVIGALVGLLKEENEHCQQDALLALDILSPNMAIQSNQLPDQTILDFLSSTRPEVRDAAVGLLELMVKENAIDIRKFIETPGALKSTLVTLQTWLDKNPEGPDSASIQKSASALLKMATEAGDDSVRLGILGSNGLSILIEYVQRSRNDTFKKLLTTMLSLICKSEKSSDQEAVIERGGHNFLLTSLRENVLKEIAARGLLSLIINRNTRGNFLQAGFVNIAVESVDQRFASTDIALVLKNICSTPEGMDQIYTSNKGVPALLILLEHCPELEGKGAAAAVIAKLYPRLNDGADLQRQTEMTNACKHLIKYLELEDKSQLCRFLKALAALATGRKGRQTIHEERGIRPLIKYLKNQRIFDNKVRDLMLKVLVEMSHIFTEENEQRDSYYHKILNVFLDQEISTLVSEDFNNNAESIENLLILIRNFSTAGQAAVTQLSRQGAVNVLLKVLKQHENDTSASVVTELAVKALEKFLDEPSERQAAFIRGGGIQLLVGVLKLQTSSEGSDDNCYATKILTAVATNPDTRKLACGIIFSCADDILRALNTIMYVGATSEVKWQAAVLIKALAMYGPTSKVCSAIKANYCHLALNHLRGVQYCGKIADDVLKFVREKSRECRTEIDGLKDPRR